MGRTLLICFSLCLVFACSSPPGVEETRGGAEPAAPVVPRAEALEKLAVARAEYEADPGDVEKLIWYGRRTAYTGDYLGAIHIYTDGIERFPKDARLWRHRGHRYITIRFFDLAIDDLRHAAGLIEGTEDQVEPDGIPNALGRPVSSLHSNIWYHLGLALYLRNDLEDALEIYRIDAARSTNDDQLVSVTHWLYMTLRRLGREEEARAVLEPIRREMDVIENMAYHRLCLFYKGELGEEGLVDPETGAVMSDAAAYGIANWYLYNGHPGKAKILLEELAAGETWASFGHIAAEADLGREFPTG